MPSLLPTEVRFELIVYNLLIKGMLEYQLSWKTLL